MARPEVSVIVPTRLRHHLLPRALQSLVEQTTRDLEVIVVDDNPPDRRLERDPKIRNLVAGAPFRVIQNLQPRSAGAARNVGLDAAAGRWIAFLDDDDAYFPEKLDLQRRAALSAGLPVGLCGMRYHLDGRVRDKQVDQRTFQGDELLLRAIPGTVAIFHQASPVRFEESLESGEDAFYFFRLLEYFDVGLVFNVPKPLVNVFPQPGARVNTRPGSEWRAAEAILQRFGNRFSTRSRRQFRRRGRIAFHKTGRGMWGQFVTEAAALLWVSRCRDWRLIANAFAYRITWLRSKVVS